MARLIKLFDPDIGIDEERNLVKTLRSKFWASGSGINNVKKFENSFNKYVGSKSCVAVNSGTAALHLALSLNNIKNKEVLLPSLSFVSTAHAVIYNGGIPKFIDVDPDTLCLDPIEVKKHITSKTKIILPVHFGGMPADLIELKKICKKNNLVLIEDAAHATGSTYDKQRIGAHGDLICFSFHPVKNLAMPSGGAITFNGKNSKKLESILKSKRWCGISSRVDYSYDVNQLGWNYYMNEFSATIGLVQLKKIEKMNRRRKYIAKRYSQEIKISSKMPFSENCSYHLYWLQVNKRKSFMKFLKENKIETGIHYKPIHHFSLYSSKLKLNNTDKIAKRIVSIPIHSNLSDNDVNQVIKLCNKFVEDYS
jgi:dTDP-4-amino-4,6-dideoxygalactose transaminase